MRKRMMISVSALALALALTGCSSQSGGESTEAPKTNKIEQTSEAPKTNAVEQASEENSRETEETPTEVATTPEESSVDIDAEHFPDETFRVFVSSYDENHNGKLEGSEVKGVRTFRLGNSLYGESERNGIYTDLKGIEYFTDLEELICDDNQLTKLDVSGLSKLQSLDCSFNQLTELNVSGLRNLTTLNCRVNKLKNLDLTGTVVMYLDCSENELTELTAKEAAGLDCYSNQLTSLEVGPSLMTLNCSDNQLESLDLTSLNLCTAYCHKNPIKTIKASYSPFYKSGDHTIWVDEGAQVTEENNSVWNINYISIEVPATCDLVTGAHTIPDGTYSMSRISGDRWTPKKYESNLWSWYTSCKVEDGFLVIEGNLLGFRTEGALRLPLADQAEFGTSDEVVTPLTAAEFNGTGGPCVIFEIRDGLVISAVYSA